METTRNNLKISRNNIKTATSVFGCLIVFLFFERMSTGFPSVETPFMQSIYFIFNRSNPIYACISAIISMQASFKDSWGWGKVRIEGTILGGIVGLGFLYLDKWLYNRSLTILLITIGILFVIWLCEASNRLKAIKFAYITFLIILLTVQKYNEPAHLFALNRTIDTIIGVLVSLVVNLIFKKVNNKKQGEIPMVKIKVASHKDLDGMLELYTHLNDYQKPEVDTRVKSVWENILNDENRYTLVAYQDKKVVSSLTLFINQSLAKNQRPFALIEYVVTSPECRGKGIATKLLEKAETIAQKSNCYKMMLITGQKNEYVHKLYKNFGFKSEGKTAYVKELGER